MKRRCCNTQSILRNEPNQLKVKLQPYGFFADDHLFDLHDLCDMVGGWFERRHTRPIIYANENAFVNVVTAIDACQTHGTISNNSSVDETEPEMWPHWEGDGQMMSGTGQTEHPRSVHAWRETGSNGERW